MVAKVEINKTVIVCPLKGLKRAVQFSVASWPFFVIFASAKGMQKGDVL